MRKFLVLLLLVALGWLAWRNRSVFDRYVTKDLAEETKTIGLAEKSARKEKARVTQTKAVDSATAGESVTSGMLPDEVRSLLGDPSSTEKDPSNNVETWTYEAVGKKVVFRNGRVWSVDPL